MFLKFSVAGIFAALFFSQSLQASQLLLEIGARVSPHLPKLNAGLLLTRTLKAIGKEAHFDSSLPRNVQINEVFPRDGLQNQPVILPPLAITEIINGIISTKKPQDNATRIEVGSLVSKQAVPQMAGSQEVIRNLRQRPDIIPSVLIPNDIGMKNLLNLLAERKDNLKPEVAVFLSASEEFCRRNLRCSIPKSLEMASSVLVTAQEYNLPTRGFISMITGAPPSFNEEIPLECILNIARFLEKMGCHEIVLADTTGIGKPKQIFDTVTSVKTIIPGTPLALHLHGRSDNLENTLANALAAYVAGIRSFDGSIGGVGGCPYSPGAPGNAPTECLVTLFESLDITTNWQETKIWELRTQTQEILAKQKHLDFCSRNDTTSQ